MKQVIAAAVLVTAASTSMAAGISKGNVDLDGWVVENQPKSSVAAVTESSGISRDNVDLYGWVVENHTAISAPGSMTERSEKYSISRGNNDLYGWVVAGAMAE